jgi:hypothetical protein
MRNFEIRLGWTPLTRALERVEAIAGESAWEEMKAAIRHKRLPARCLADGVTKEFEPHGLDFLAWDRPEVRDVLWFDRVKAIAKAYRCRAARKTSSSNRLGLPNCGQKRRTPGQRHARLPLASRRPMPFAGF